MTQDPGTKAGGEGRTFSSSPTGTNLNPEAMTASLPLFQLRKILVPTDFSKCAEKALQYAIPFARQFGAELILLHVIAPAIVLQSSEMMLQGIPESTAEAQLGLDELRKTIGGGISAQTLLRHGSAPIEIIDTAKELDVDLIILSTHGRTGLSHVLLGNTVEKVVRRASCPVLVVREHEHEFIKVSYLPG